jgi:hypothetical protein
MPTTDNAVQNLYRKVYVCGQFFMVLLHLPYFGGNYKWRGIIHRITNLMRNLFTQDLGLGEELIDFYGWPWAKRLWLKRRVNQGRPNPTNSAN